MSKRVRDRGDGKEALSTVTIHDADGDLIFAGDATPTARDMLPDGEVVGVAVGPESPPPLPTSFQEPGVTPDAAVGAAVPGEEVEAPRVEE